ncbi:MAG TPA: S8 family serine peptidase, partial [Planctomycetota bacterium]|nr:S8 family serine peptidase [Planctomycetota bacterium]
RAKILKKHGFAVRRKNAFAPDQVVAAHAQKRKAGAELVAVANDFAEMSEVVFATPNFVSEFRRSALPKIPVAQWHLKNTAAVAGEKLGEDVDAEGAWAITRGKTSVVIAVLDDGVDVDHPNLRGRIWKNRNKSSPDRLGRDFFLPNDHPDHFNPRPKKFRFPFDQMEGNDIHGTCCAGVIVAAGDGAFGVAFRSRVLAVKIFHADELAPDERVADAIRYAARHADILSCSWSGGRSPDIELALADAGKARGGLGAAIFCAAGNESGSPVGYPASDPNAIAVGASTDQATLAFYSNVGPEIAVVAPSSGGKRGIFTTDVSIPNRGFNIGLAAEGGADGLHTNSFGGTSSATPLTAGVGALVLSVDPKLTRLELRDVLTRTADKIGGGYDAQGHSNKFGFGRVSAEKAVTAAQAGKKSNKTVAAMA